MKSLWNLGSIEDITCRMIGGLHLSISSSSARFFWSWAHVLNTCNQLSISGGQGTLPLWCCWMVFISSDLSNSSSASGQGRFSGMTTSAFWLNFRFNGIISSFRHSLSLSLFLSQRLELQRSSLELLQPLLGSASTLDRGEQYKSSLLVSMNPMPIPRMDLRSSTEENPPRASRMSTISVAFPLPIPEILAKSSAVALFKSIRRCLRFRPDMAKYYYLKPINSRTGDFLGK